MQNVKQRLQWLWKEAERILIVAFFLTFSLNIHKVFLTPYSFLNGGFNEYMTMSFSWADLLMIAVILVYNIKLLFRQFNTPTSNKSLYKNVIHNLSSVIRNYYSKIVSRETFYLLIFLVWIGLSIFWSQYRPIAIYRFLTLIEIALFATVAIKYLRNNRWLRIGVFALVLNGLFQSLLSIAQFIHNGSLSLHFLGESIIGPNINGVAKIVIVGEKHIRAYGTFPHPNILAGFLLVPLFLILAELISRRLLLPYKGEVERGSDFNYQNLTPALSLSRRGSSNNAPHETFLWFIPRSALFVILLITGSGFFLTFSRSAFLGLFIGLAIYFVWITFSWRSNKVSKNTLKFLSLLIFIITLFIIILISNTSFFSSQSLQERQLYQIVSYETISSNPIRGIGIGQFVLNGFTLHPNLATWQYQPVHNTYLLIFSELGIIGFIIFLLFVVSIFSRIRKDEQSGGSGILTYIAFCCMILSFFVISLFDHYFWDIRLGTFVFALPLIILSAELKKEKD